jgi:hypothetical protein
MVASLQGRVRESRSVPQLAQLSKEYEALQKQLDEESYVRPFFLFDLSLSLSLSFSLFSPPP